MVVGDKFRINLIYAKLRPVMPKVNWRRILLNNSASPKSLFVTWLAVQHRLTTKDRLISWNVACDPLCVLCGTSPETVQHLFFAFTFSAAVWESVLSYVGVVRKSLSFDSELQWVLHRCRRTDSRSRLVVLLFSETIHCLWLLRNAIVFAGPGRSARLVCREIVFRAYCRCKPDLRHVLGSGH